MTPKHNLRLHYSNIRSRLPIERRSEASRRLFLELFALKGPVLSFSSFGSEIDLGLLNDHYSKQNQLLLPLRNGDQLDIFWVKDLEKQLFLTSSGIKEPIAQLCEKADLASISYILVPGLAFDSMGHRLGYGRGYYDRILSTQMKTIGVGFKEQLFHEQLPIDPWDKPVQKLLLV